MKTEEIHIHASIYLSILAAIANPAATVTAPASVQQLKVLSVRVEKSELEGIPDYLIATVEAPDDYEGLLCSIAVEVKHEPDDAHCGDGGDDGGRAAGSPAEQGS